MSLTQREAFARTVEHMCRHDGDGGHGYSQYARWGDGTWETVDLGDDVIARIANGDRDCSSGVISALRAVGIDTGDASYTGNMRAEIIGRNPGLFAWSQRVARRGDIYLNEHHHTAMCTSADPDMLAQFSISENGTISGRKGDQTGRESNIRSYYSYPWDGKIVWLGDGKVLGGAGPAPAKPKTTGDPLDVDGLGGPLTIDRWQRACGTPYDGKITGQYEPNRRYFGTLWSVVYSCAHEGSAMVRHIQRLGGLVQDGVLGHDTAGFVQQWLVSHGYSVGPSGIDHILGHDSVQAVQRSLNDGGGIWN